MVEKVGSSTDRRMDRDAYRRLHRRLAQEGLFAIDSRAGAAALGMAGAFSLAVLALVARAHGPDRLIWQVLLGLSMFNWFVILHECGHYTFLRPRWLNGLVGCLASMFCLVPFVPWREVHVQHHLWVGVVDRDPTQKSLLRLKRIGGSQILFYRLWWRLWLPVLFAHFILETYWLYPLQRLRAGDARGFRRSLASIAICAAPHAAMIAWAGPLQWAVWVLPAYVVFLVVFENISIPQHAGLTPYLSDDHPRPIHYKDQAAVTRSTRLPDLVATAVALNFNFHSEHHLFPKAPWHALKRLRAILVEESRLELSEVAFPQFVADLRGRDPLSVYRDALPEAPASS